MEFTNTDEWYEILDELNALLEEIFNECYYSQTCELIIPYRS